MLILSFQLDQKAIVTLPDGRRGSIHVTHLTDSRVRLGLDFPRDVEINREAIQEVIDMQDEDRPDPARLAARSDRLSRLDASL